MESWRELGGWSGHSGNKLETWRLTCPFCEEEGNFIIAHHAEKQKGSSTKKLNFDLYQCMNCMAYVHVFWSAANVNNITVKPLVDKMKKAKLSARTVNKYVE